MAHSSNSALPPSRNCLSPDLRYLTASAVSAEESDDASSLEVFVAARPLAERGLAILRQYPNLALQVGICHFLTVFKTKNGGLYQFDFGPTGGRDIQVRGGPVAWLLKENKEGERASPIHGEIRETKLVDLPDTHLYVGKSKLTIQDIRNFNNAQCKNYELHVNDCRHYVNNVVLHTTGMQSASVQLIRDQLKKKKNELPHFGSNILRLIQIVTNVSNWPKVKATGNATMATILYLSGSGVAARTRAALAGPVFSKIPAHPARKAAVAALAYVAVARPQAPIVKRMASLGNVLTAGASRAVAGAGSVVQGAGKTVSKAIVTHPRELQYARRGRLVAAGTKRMWF